MPLETNNPDRTINLLVPLLLCSQLHCIILCVTRGKWEIQTDRQTDVHKRGCEDTDRLEKKFYYNSIP